MGGKFELQPCNTESKDIEKQFLLNRFEQNDSPGETFE